MILFEDICPRKPSYFKIGVTNYPKYRLDLNFEVNNLSTDQ